MDPRQPDAVVADLAGVDPLPGPEEPLGLGRSLTFRWPQWRARDGRRTVFFDQGSGRPLVLVHGLGGNATHWELVARPLWQERRVAALDLVGCGWSAKPQVPYTVALLRDHLSAFLDMRGIRRAVLAGHSLGAAVCVALALEQPHRVEALVLASPVGLAPLPAWMRRAARLVLRQGLLYPVIRHAPRTLLGSGFAQSPRRNANVRWFLDSTARDEAGGANVRDLARFAASILPELTRGELHRDLPRLAMPVLAVAGQQDSLTAPLLGALDAIPRLQRQIIPRCGHTPMVELPDLFLRILREYFHAHAL